MIDEVGAVPLWIPAQGADHDRPGAIDVAVSFAVVSHAGTLGITVIADPGT